MLMRLRLPELLPAGLTAYALAQQSGGRISTSTAYRLVKLEGRVANFDAEMLEALCDVLGVPPGELFERDKPGTRSTPPRKRDGTAKAAKATRRRG